MTKSGKTGLVLIGVVFCIAVFCGCTEGQGALSSTAKNLGDDPDDGGYMGELGTFEGLSAETELRILQDYFAINYLSHPEYQGEETVNDIWVAGYYGAYNGCVVVSITGHNWMYISGGGELFVMIHFPGFSFRVEPYQDYIAWKDGQIFDLNEAYYLGLLTQDDIRSMGDGYYDPL